MQLDCSALLPICADFTLSASFGDPFEPGPPICPILGEFTDEFDFQICRCEHTRYSRTLLARVECIVERRAQEATAIYHEAVRVYNCRLTKDRCEASSRLSWALFTTDHSNKRPEAPSCVTFLTSRRFYDSYDANDCSREIDSFYDDLERWVELEGEDAVRDAKYKIDDAIRRFNCHASGKRICF